MNEIWSMGFMHDRLADKRSYRLLNIADIFSRECVATEVAQFFRSEDVVRVLKNACRERGLPKAIRCDNETAFVATPVDRWAYANRVQLDFSRPGTPTDHAFIESSNGGVRLEFLNSSYFETLDEARRAARILRIAYNEFRTHSMLANKTSNEYARSVESNPMCRFYTVRNGP
ncbi:MAG: DDE-type integrase/transposase/recombinase [Candidatus Baltobacteraceae bacterium]